MAVEEKVFNFNLTLTSCGQVEKTKQDQQHATDATTAGAKAIQQNSWCFSDTAADVVR